MCIEFDKDYLKELFEKGKSRDRKHSFQPEVIRGYQKVILILMSANRVSDLFKFNSLNYEALKGDKFGISSVRINKKYRLEFTVRELNDEPIVTICKVLDISNHYR